MQSIALAFGIVDVCYLGYYVVHAVARRVRD